MGLIRIYGDIMETQQLRTQSVSARDVFNQLQNIQDNEVIVHINSRGGDVSEGFAIYDILKNSGKDITTVVDGKCYSIATVILLAGDKRKMMPNAELMIHNPWVQPQNAMDAEDLQKMANNMMALNNRIANFYSSHTGQMAQSFMELMKAETFINAETALNMGLITEIAEPVKAFAMFKDDNINLKNNNMNDKNLFEKAVNALKTAFNIEEAPAPKNMELTDKDGNKLIIEKEEGDVMVGDKATPDGNYTMEDGTVIVVMEGEVKEINAPTEEPSEEMKKLTDENAALNAKVEELTKALAEKEEAVKAFEAEKAIKASKVSNVFKPSARAQSFQEPVKESYYERKKREAAENK